MRDRNNNTLSRGDWIVYASKNRTRNGDITFIRYARVVYVKDGYASVLPVDRYSDDEPLHCSVGPRRMIYSPPLRVQSYEVPEVMRKAVEMHKFYNEWFG